MKIRLKIVVLSAVQLLFVHLLSAQYDKELGDYRCDIVIRAYDPSSHNPNCDNYYECYTKFVGEGEVVRLEGDKNNLDYISEDPNRLSTYTLSFIIPGNKQLEYVRFYTMRRRKSWGDCEEYGSGSEYCYFTGMSIYPCAVHSFTNVWKAYKANATYTFTPVQVKLFNEKGISTDGVLPENQNITYKVNQNYSGGRFTWYYGNSASSMPNVLPCGNGPSGTFSGQTIRSAYLDAIKNSKRIYIKASPVCSSAVSAIGLDVPKEAPRLLVNTAQLNIPLCANEATGSVKINISPSVLNNEVLYVAIQEDDLKYYNTTVLRAGASFIEFKNLPSGKYELVFLSGTYPDTTRPTYVGDPTYHRYRFTLQDPPELTMQQIEPVDVRCYGGNDGKILFMAGGGTGQLYIFDNSIGMRADRDKVSEISELSVGEHLIQLMDGRGCMSKDATGKEKMWKVTIGQPERPVVVQQMSLKEPTGYGRSDGEIQVVARDGTGSNYTYVWERDGVALAGNDSVQRMIPAGQYKVWARDENYALVENPTAENLAGCQDAVDIELKQPGKLAVTLKVGKPHTCPGSYDGFLEAEVTGGIGGFTYRWQSLYSVTGNWVNEWVLDNTIPYFYMYTGDSLRVIVYDKNGDVAISAPFIPTYLPDFDVCFTQTPPSCYGSEDGKIEANVAGGNGGYTYQWRGFPDSGPVIQGKADTYIFTVKDSKGCTVTKNVVLEDPAPLTATMEVSPPSGPDASDGQLLVVPSGGTPGYTYRWNHEGATANPLTGLPADRKVYQVVVRDVNGCETALSTRMILPLRAEIRLKDPVSCYGRSDGRLEAVAAGGGDDSYAYKWYKQESEGFREMPENGTLAGGLGEGVYQVKVWDGELNEATSPEFVLGQPDSLSLSFAHGEPLCKGDRNGWVNAGVTGGTQPYHYVWEDRTGWDRPKLEGLGVGAYTVEITDSRGCRIGGRDSLAEPDSLLVTHEVSFPTLYGGTDGVIRLFPVGGTAPYRYQWVYGNADANPLTGVAASDTPYEVTVTDAHGCTVADTPRMYNPLIAAILVRDSVSCYGRTDGRLAAVFAGGVGAPHAFRWLKENEEGQFIPTGTNDSILYQVADGIYRVEVRDCRDSLAVSPPFAFRQPDSLQLAFRHAFPLCKHDVNGRTEAMVTGGTTPYRYLWVDQHTEGAALRENLGAGHYEVVVTDRRGCLIAGKDTLTEPDSLTLKHKVDLPSVYGAADGSILLEPAGGTSPYRYTWDYRSSTANPLTGLSAMGSPLRAVVTDAHGCQARDSAYMYNPVTIELEESGVIVCSGETNAELTAHVKGGAGRPYRFEWYFVEDDWVTKLPEKDSLLAQIGVGTYRVVALDSVGNRGVAADYTIYSPDSLRMEFEIGDLPCKYDKKGWIEAIPLGGEAPYRFEWFNGSTDVRVENLEEGRYEVKLTDHRGCFITRKVKIDSPDELLLSMDSRQPLGWQGRDGAIWVTPVGGTQPYHYQWEGFDNERDTLAGIPAGTYSVIVTDGHLCRKTISGEVTQPPLLEAAIGCSRVISCYGFSDGILQATATGGVGQYRYDWYLVDGRKDQWLATGAGCPDVVAGSYKVKVTDGNGIVAWAGPYILGQPEPLRAVTEVSGVLCDGDTNGEIKASAEGGVLPYRYLWTTGDEGAELTGLAAGRYLVMVKDGHGCRAEALGTIVSPPALAVTTGVTDPICYGGDGSVELAVTGGTGKYQIAWPDGVGKLKRDDLKAGRYEVTVTDDNGCFRKDEFELQQPEQIVIDLGKERTLCREQELELLPLNVEKVSRYKWLKDSEAFGTRSSVTVTEAGLYRLEIETRRGCFGSGEVRIRKSNAVIDVNFAMASEVETDNLLKVVNTCLPMPEYCEWIIPDVAGLDIVSDDKDLAELLFSRTGEYTIGLRSIVGECEASLYKQVRVIPAGTGQPPTRAAERIIGDIQAWPNPNDGHFRLRVSLNQKASGLIRLYALTGVLLREQKCEGDERYELSFNESLPTGVYIIHVIFGNEREAVKIMVE